MRTFSSVSLNSSQPDYFTHEMYVGAMDSVEQSAKGRRESGAPPQDCKSVDNHLVLGQQQYTQPVTGSAFSPSVQQEAAQCRRSPSSNLSCPPFQARVVTSPDDITAL